MRFSCYEDAARLFKNRRPFPLLLNRHSGSTIGQIVIILVLPGLRLHDQIQVQGFPLEGECEFEAKGTHSVDEMMKLVEVHAGDEHRTLRLSPEMIERIRGSLAKQSRV